MLGKMQGMMKQFQAMQKLMGNENFRAVIAHPKVQELLKDPEFKEIAKSQDFSKIAAHSKFAEVMSDPELAGLISKLSPGDFMKGPE